MRTKITLVLLLLNVALYGFIFFVAPPWAEKDPALTRRRVLPPETATAIDRIEIRRAGSASITIEKTGNAWRIAPPNTWPANPNAVDRILSELQTLEHETSFPVSELATGGQTLADFGLQPAALTVVFSTNGKSSEIQIGAPTAASNRLYIFSPTTARIHVVSRSLADALRVNLDSLRDSNVFDIPVFESRSLAVQLGDPASSRVRISRTNDRWMFETPIQTRADRKRVERTINQLNTLTVASFPENISETTTGLENPSLRILIEGNQRRQTLLLGDPVSTTASTENTTELYARMEDRVPLFTVRLEPALLELIRKAQTELRDHRLADFNPARLASIEIKAPDTVPILLQNLDPQTAPQPQAATWQLIVRDSSQNTPRSTAADPGILKRLISALEILEIEIFESDAPSAAELENAGFNRPDRQINLTFAGAPAVEPLMIEIGSRVPGRDGFAYARISGSPFIYQIRTDLLAEFSVTPRHYRERTLRSLPPGARVSGLRITRLKDSAVVFEKIKVDSWETALADQSETIRAAAQQLMNQLRTLRARSFVSETFADPLEIAGETQTWAYRVETTIALSGGDSDQISTSNLLLTERLSGSEMYAGSEEFSACFLASQELLDAVFAITNAPHDPGAPAASEVRQPKP